MEAVARAVGAAAGAPAALAPPIAAFFQRTLFGEDTAVPAAAAAQVLAAADSADAVLDGVWLASQRVSGSGSKAQNADADANGNGNGNANTPRKRLEAILAECFAQNIIPKSLALERLEPDLLFALKVVEKRDFLKCAVKFNGIHFFSQDVRPVLAEETEGYAVLFEYLDGVKSEGETAPQEISGLHFEAKLLELVGRFKLDPRRVCEAILCALEVSLSSIDLDLDTNPELVEQKVLEFGEAPNLGTRSEPRSAAKSEGLLMLLERAFDRDMVLQLTGFAFQHYQRLELRDSSSSTSSSDDRRPWRTRCPDSLYRVAALLITRDVFTWEALYPHLQPDDSDMVPAFDRWCSAAASAGEAAADIGRKNVGLAVFEQTAVPVADSLDEARLFVTDHNQKCGLIVGLLTQGTEGWQHADLLLRKLNRVDPASHPGVRAALLSLLDAALKPYAESANPGKVELLGWSKSTPSPQPAAIIDVATAVTVVLPLLEHLHLHIGRNLLIYSRVQRIFGAMLQHASEQKDSDGLNYDDACRVVERVCAKALLPALACCPNNPAVGHGLWDTLLQFLPFHRRFVLYSHWQRTVFGDKGVSATVHPQSAYAVANANRALSASMRRLAKENVKEIGRQIAKVAHSVAPVVFRQILTTVQVIDSLIDPVIESLRFMSPLELDVCAATIVQELSDTISSGKKQLKEDGQNVALWFANLCQFAGAFHRGYHLVELGALLEHVASRLRISTDVMSGNAQDVVGQSLDIVPLQMLLAHMAACEPTHELSDSQLAQLGGGPVLKRLATMTGMSAVAAASSSIASATSAEGTVSAVTSSGAAAAPTVLSSAVEQRRFRRAAQSLAVALCGPLSDTSRAASANSIHTDAVRGAELLVLVARQRQRAAFATDTQHLELIGELRDRCQDTLLALTEFLEEFSTDRQKKALAAALPDLDVLIHECGLDAASAWAISRPFLHLKYSGVDALRLEGTNERVPAADHNSGDATRRPFADVVRAMLVDPAESSAEPNIPPALYASFWALTLYDCSAPMDEYRARIELLEAELQNIMRAQTLTFAERDSKREIIHSALQQLRSEQTKHATHTLKFIAEMKKGAASVGWMKLDLSADASLQTSKETAASIIQHFVQFCIVPRLLFGGPDAVFVTQFVFHVLHTLNPQGLSIPYMLDCMLRSVPVCLFTASNAESRRLAVVLQNTLAVCAKWRSATIFDEECAGRATFADASVGDLFKAPDSETVPIDLEKFTRLTLRWHRRLSSVFLVLLGHGTGQKSEEVDFTDASAALRTLARLAERRLFPATVTAARPLLRAIQALCSDERSALKLAAIRCQTLIQQQLGPSGGGLPADDDALLRGDTPVVLFSIKQRNARGEAVGGVGEVTVPAGPLVDTVLQLQRDGADIEAIRRTIQQAETCAAPSSVSSATEILRKRSADREGDNNAHAEPNKRMRPDATVNDKDSSDASRKRSRKSPSPVVERTSSATSAKDTDSSSSDRAGKRPRIEVDKASALRDALMKRADEVRDETRRDETRRDEPRRDEPRRDEPRRDEPRRDESRRDDSRRPDARRDSGERRSSRERLGSRERRSSPDRRDSLDDLGSRAEQGQRRPSAPSRSDDSRPAPRATDDRILKPSSTRSSPKRSVSPKPESVKQPSARKGPVMEVSSQAKAPAEPARQEMISRRVVRIAHDGSPGAGDDSVPRSPQQETTQQTSHGRGRGGSRRRSGGRGRK